jgi:perosamine synthetase
MNFLHQVEPYLSGTEKEALGNYLDSGGWLTEFQKTAEFEQMISTFAGISHSTVVTSGTVAIYLALLAAGIGPGDKVIVPNYTMIATPNAVAWTGAEVLLADIDPINLCISLNEITEDCGAKALLYVPINGRSGDMDQIKNWCKDRGIILIEDACQAMGSCWDGKQLGTFGKLGIFSFTPHKIVTTGQGGAVVTGDDALYARLKKLKDFHRTAPATDSHDGLGFNFKFTDLQAVVGIEQMKTIDERIHRKKQIWSWYVSFLEGVEEVSFLPTDLTETTPWFVDPIFANEKIRNDLQNHLKADAIGSRPFYPPINYQSIYKNQGQPMASLPVSEDMATRGLWLPSSIGLTQSQVKRVCDSIKDFFGRFHV